MHKQVFGLVSTIFNCPIEIVTESSSPDTIDGWDSIRHMSLILALEETFNVKFSDDEAIDMLEVSSIISILKEKLSS